MMFADRYVTALPFWVIRVFVLCNTGIDGCGFPFIWK